MDDILERELRAQIADWREENRQLRAALRDILRDWDSPNFRTYYIDEAHIEAARAALALSDAHSAGSHEPTVA